MTGCESKPPAAEGTAPPAATRPDRPDRDRVGFAGLGIMGSRMAAHIAAAGHELTVFNRTRATAEAFAERHGAAVAATMAELAAASDVLFTMVVDGPQVRELLLGPGGAVRGATAGLLCVDCSTISPADTRAIGAELAEAGIGMLDAPVTGSSPRALDGTLTFMAGGERADLEHARPLLELMGSRIVHCGPLGQGETVKLINNALAAANTLAAAEALLLARAADVDVDALLDAVAGGSGASAVLALKGEPMRRGDFSTLFKTAHMLKDVELCLEQSRAAGTRFHTAAAARDALAAAVDAGHADDDFCSIIETLAQRDADA